MKFEIFPNEMSKVWVVYILQTADGQLYHVGLCPYSDVLTTPDARRNASFNPSQSYTLTIIRLHNNKIDAQRTHSDYLRNNGGATPLMRASIMGRTSIIICNETQRIFRTIGDVCKEYNIHQSAVSNHINNKPGYKHVKGMTFKRTDCPNPTILARLRMGEALTIKDLGGPQHA